MSGEIKAGSTPVYDGSCFQVLLQSRRDHLWFCFKKEDQKATAGKSTTEKELPAERGRAAVLQMRSQAGARGVNSEFLEDAAAQYLRLC